MQSRPRPRDHRQSGGDSSSLIPDRRGSWLLPKPYGNCSRSPGAPPTNRRPEKEAATTPIKPSGSALREESVESNRISGVEGRGPQGINLLVLFVSAHMGS